MSNAPSRPLLLGHRGARGVRSIRENTLASFDRALADGCDGFEFDVRRTADGEAVICHDPDSRGLRIANLPAIRLPKLLRLSHVFEKYRSRAFLDVELKVPGLESAVKSLLQKFPPRRGFVVSSFLPDVLRVLHDQDAQIPLGLICERRKELDRWPELPITYVIAHRKLVTRSLCDKLRTAGKKLMVWTVNDPAEMRRFHKCGVDGIISDKPALLRRTFQRQM
jgi:glycerophosphoryl diester phosphodiesterase